MEQWPPVLKKRRVGKPTLDDQYTRALCDWVEDLPQAKRPGWWRHGMSLFGERSAPLGEAEASIPELGGRLRTAGPLARMGQQEDYGPPDGMAVVRLPTLAVDADTANREMLAMCSYPLCERSATVLARQASRSPRL